MTARVRQLAPMLRQNLSTLAARDRASTPPLCRHPEGRLVTTQLAPTWAQLRCTRCRAAIATYSVRGTEWTVERYHLPDGEPSCVL